MKVTVTMKDPDTMPDAVRDAVKADVKALNLPPDESELLIEARVEKAMNAMGRWFEYSEYLAVTFDLDHLTATVEERD